MFERGGILLPWCLQNPQEAYVMVTSVGIQVDWRSWNLKKKSHSKATDIYKELCNMEEDIQRELCMWNPEGQMAREHCSGYTWRQAGSYYALCVHSPVMG